MKKMTDEELELLLKFVEALSKGSALNN